MYGVRMGGERIARLQFLFFFQYMVLVSFMEIWVKLFFRPIHFLICVLVPVLPYRTDSTCTLPPALGVMELPALFGRPLLSLTGVDSSFRCLFTWVARDLPASVHSFFPHLLP